jgi:hypothetical protein
MATVGRHLRADGVLRVILGWRDFRPECAPDPRCRQLFSFAPHGQYPGSLCLIRVPLIFVPAPAGIASGAKSRATSSLLFRTSISECAQMLPL